MASFIMFGPLQATGFVLLFALLSFVFLPLMGLFSSAAIALVTLRIGWQRGLLIAGISSTLLGVLSLVLYDDIWRGFWGGLSHVLTGESLPKFFGMQLWLPTIGLATVLCKSVSWSRTLTVLFGSSLSAVLLFHLIVGDVVAFWQAQPFWPHFVEMAESLQALPADLPAADKQHVLNGVAGVFSGSIAAGVSLFLVVSLLIARHWQSQLYNVGGFQAEWNSLRVGKVAAFCMLGMIVAALLSSQTLVINLVFAGLAVFLFQGIALVHGIIAGLQQSKKWLLGLYLPLLLLPVQVSILLAAFGIIDGLADFRGQLKARKD